MAEDRLKERMDNAQEAEADPGRHHMEEAILATLATDPFDQDAIAHAARSVAWSRPDYKAIATALLESITEGITVDLVIIKDKLRTAGAKVEDAVLTGILNGEKAADVSIALAYIGKVNALDKYRDAHAAGMDYLKAVAKAKEAGGDIDAAFADLTGKVFDLATGK
ncbi:MAG: DnaB-like helicase N-terminal domain-containing protein, partial [Candidatus Omnitrophota bacterium]|nr:DnaB-like helicase N-terminal domain-containing protein [Candidatus Omnitrophota bacterium]